jgi:hypothetical protein
MMRDLKAARATTRPRFGGVTQVLSAYNSGAGLVFHCRDSDLEWPGNLVPLHTPNRCASVGFGGNYFRT